MCKHTGAQGFEGAGSNPVISNDFLILFIGMRNIIIFTIILLTFIFIGCSKPVTLKFDGTNYYQVVNGQVIAFDGTNWFQLRQAEQALGNMSGQDYAITEQWLMLGSNGSHVSPYHRTLATKNNTNLPPVFIR